MSVPKRIGYEIKSLSQMFRHEIDGMMAGIFPSKDVAANGWILHFLFENRERDVFQRDIEERFHLRRSTVSKMIRTMTKNGLLLCESVSYDARLKKLVLTPLSLHLHSRVCHGIEEMDARICRGISREELELFYDIIDRMKANLNPEENV